MRQHKRYLRTQAYSPIPKCKTASSSTPSSQLPAWYNLPHLIDKLENVKLPDWRMPSPAVQVGGGWRISTPTRAPANLLWITLPMQISTSNASFCTPSIHPCLLHHATPASSPHVGLSTCLRFFGSSALSPMFTRRCLLSLAPPPTF